MSTACRGSIFSLDNVAEIILRGWNMHALSLNLIMFNCTAAFPDKIGSQEPEMICHVTVMLIYSLVGPPPISDFDIIRTNSTCRETSRNVEKCWELSRNVEKCRVLKNFEYHKFITLILSNLCLRITWYCFHQPFLVVFLWGNIKRLPFMY